ncbi:hypothetical protein GO986_21095 [Deinococcus sp. HMF7620]|uniref:Uncharacterized protein n=1 Tax=Deinococcus arboris TaxID=2682977 RepID=A0A7C9I254_9DEIO|nr:hypothetical protein [Deinococcus arboris]MVN89235.1 hypothetical protein [Deinococcus arboris]
MSLGLWLVTLLACVLAPVSVMALGRRLPQVSVSGLVGEGLTAALLAVLLLNDAPLYALLLVFVAGAGGTGLALARHLR